ncbi:hypothetical protein BLNAU_20750 [Blattamonas nauphoetae]|uniref:Uncharacterized protein n=1 Tax=Blattamonas nauphoetae TaxID=2049346 RepID=A0ABQ9WXW1_9EUKA|nr:hypothetical protein BLNAU_20750 [Blattamonas nauphoetae]
MAQSCSPTISQAGLDIPPEQTIIETHAEDVPFEIVNFDDSDLGHVQPPNDLNTIQQQLQPFQIEFSYVSASNIFSIPPIISLFRLFNPYSSLQDPTSFASSHPPQFPFHVHHHSLHQNNIIPIPLLSPSSNSVYIRTIWSSQVISRFSLSSPTRVYSPSASFERPSIPPTHS